MSIWCRWKQILEAYNEVRGRLLNSQPLLEGTNLMLFTINEATLSKWHKNSTRGNEVKMLLQGLPSLPSSTTAVEPLPPALERFTSPPPPPDNPHIFPESEDRRGLAHVRSAPAPNVPTFGVLTSSLPTTSAPSRTTEWRWRQKEAAAEEALPRLKKARKEYSCRICNEVMSTG